MTFPRVYNGGSTYTVDGPPVPGPTIPVVRWAANTAYPAGYQVVAPTGQIVQANSSFTSGSSYNPANWTVVNDIGAGGGGGGTGNVTDLTDTPSSSATPQAVIGQTIQATSPGAVVTGPAVPSTVGTPPARWGVRNLSGSPITVSFPDNVGATITPTLLNGASRYYRQTSTSGWSLETGIPLKEEDKRYALYGSGSQGIYVPSSWGSAWRSKLAQAKAGTALARACHVTDSTGGYYCSNLESASWGALLRAQLQTAYGDGGMGYKTTFDSSLWLTADSVVSALVTAWSNAGCLVSTSGTWAATSPGVFEGTGYTFLRASATGASITWTTRGRFVGFRCLQHAGYNVTVTIDGTQVATVTASTGTADDGNYSFVGTAAAGIGTYLKDMGSGATGTHTITVTTATGNGTIFDFNGFIGRNSAGVVFDRYWHGGFGSHAINNLGGVTQTTGLTMTAATDRVTKTAHGLLAGTQVSVSSVTGTFATTTPFGNYWVANPDVNTFQLATVRNGIPIDFTADGTLTLQVVGEAAFANNIGLWNNNVAAGTYGTAGKWSGGSQDVHDLVIECMALNDSASIQTPPDVWERNQRAYWSDVMEGSSGATAGILVLMHPGNIETGRATVGLHAEYAARARGIAEYYGLAIVSLGAPVGQSTSAWTALGYWGVNNTPAGSTGTSGIPHMSDAGHQAIAAALAPLVLAT